MRSTEIVVLMSVTFFHCCCIVDSAGPTFPTTWTDSQTFGPFDVHAYFSFAAYDETFDDDSIFVFGGTNGINDDAGDMYKYSISEDSFTFYDTLTNVCVIGKSTTAIVDGVIYFGNRYVPWPHPFSSCIRESGLYSYNLATKNETKLQDARVDCLVKHPSVENNLIYVVSNGDFLIYDIENNRYTQGESLEWNDQDPACVATNHNAEGITYFYSLFGTSQFVERLNLDSCDLENEPWEVVGEFKDVDGYQFESFSSVSGFAVISYYNYIYLFGGWHNGQVFYYDIVENKFGHIGSLPMENTIGGLYAILANNRIYAFSTFQFSDPLSQEDVITFPPAPGPTCFPTSMPTSNPTEPTATPTSAPTRSPTLQPTTSSPTAIPTIDPSGHPTLEPSIEPTFDPTLDPTLYPSFDPTRYPTSKPTALPSRGPTPDPSIQPTNSPVLVFLESCEIDPCDCNDDEVDPFCNICAYPDGPGCSQCRRGYFKLDYNYPCANCKQVFGKGCKFCQDFNGCAQCDKNYVRRFDPDSKAHYCVNCHEIFGDGCKVCQQHGCAQCKKGYGMINNRDGVRVCVLSN